MAVVEVVVDGAVHTVTQTTLLGRGDACAIRVDDPRVSREHAELSETAGQWTLTDRSSGGTWQGDQRITQVAIDRPLQFRLGTEGAPTITVRPQAAFNSDATVAGIPIPPAVNSLSAEPPRFVQQPPSSPPTAPPVPGFLATPASTPAKSRWPLVAGGVLAGCLALGLGAMLANGQNNEGTALDEATSTTVEEVPTTSVTTTAPATTTPPSATAPSTTAPPPTTTAPPTTAPPTTAPPATQSPSTPSGLDEETVSALIVSELVDLNNPYAALPVEDIPEVARTVCGLIEAANPTTTEDFGSVIIVIHSAFDVDAAEVEDTAELVGLLAGGFCPELLPTG